MKGADIVLRLGKVDTGFAAIRGVDLGDERRRHLHNTYAALVGGGAEPGDVTDHTAAERDHYVGARHARACHLGPDDLGVSDRLGLLAGHDADARERRLEQIPVMAAGVVIAHDDAAASHRLRPEAMLGHEAGAHVDGIVAGGGARPDQTRCPVRHALGGGQRLRHGVEAVPRDDHVGQLLIHGPPLFEELREALRVARQRARATTRADPLPGLVELDVEPHDPGTFQRLADSRRGHGAAAQRKRLHLGVTQQLERHPLLQFAEGALPLTREDLLDTASLARLDHGVDVNAAGPERARGRRLAGAHEADQSNLGCYGGGGRVRINRPSRLGHRRQPIRSS